MKRFILVGKQCYSDFSENKISEYVEEAKELASNISMSTGINCSVQVIDNSIPSHGYDWSEDVVVVALTKGRFFNI